MVILERESGIDLIGPLPWGTHFGLFYKTKQDLVDVLVPYFIAGLKNGEFCVWVTAEPLDAGEAKARMAAALPDFDAYMDKGQIEVIPYTEWYEIDGVFDPDRVLAGWAEKLQKARERGFDGLRVTGNVSWPGPGLWKEFIGYEQKVNDVIGQYEMLAACAYPLEKCDGNDILDVVGTHQFVLTRRNGDWKIIEDEGQKKARKALRESERFLEGVFEGIQEGICILDRDMNIVKANHAMEEWYAHMLPLCGKKCYEAYQRRAGPCEDCPSLRAIKEKTKHMSIVPYTDMQGVAGWMELYAFPLLDDHGNVLGVIEHVRDITGRKRAEEALRESKSRLEAILASMNDGLLIIDARGKIILYNDATVRYYKFRDEGEFLSHIDDFTHVLEVRKPDGDLLSVEEWPFSRALGGEVLSHYELLIRRRDTGDTWLGDYSAAPIRDKNGGVSAAVITMRDITGSKRGEQALKEAKVQAELYLDLMGHDIRNMNQVSMGYLELALESPDVGKKGKEYLLKSMGALENSTRLIENVRKLQKARSGELKHHTVDACQALMRVLARYSSMPGVNASFSFALPPSCPVKADDLLFEVFENIVGNAIKHGGPEQAIDVRFDEVDLDGGRYARFIVEDNGPGIPDGMKERIFNRMQQGDTRAKGMGLGLYLVRSLVDNYGGKVWAEDRVKGDHAKGARLVVMLPAAEQ